MAFAVRNLLYWGIPTLYSLLVMALYFSGSESLVDWVAPRTVTKPWSDYGDRELGMLENAQHLLLLACIWVLIRFYPRAEHSLQRVGAVLGILVLAFMFFEEIDYGIHYRDWIVGTPAFRGDVNFHNNSGHTGTMKQAADAIMLLWFVLLPLLAPLTRFRWLHYFAAPRMIVLTVVAALLMSKLAHALDDRGLATRVALSNNISEFRELFTYYVWLLYCGLMVKRPWPGAGRTEDA